MLNGKSFFPTLLCFLLTTALFAQTTNKTSDSSDEIELKVTLLGYRFFQNDERLTWRELEDATESVQEANALIRKAKTQNRLSSIFAFTGGGLLGIPLGQQLADRDPNWELAYVSGAALIVSLHLSFRAFNNANKGVDLYNLETAKTASWFNPEFRLVASSNRFGLAMRF